MVANHHIGPVYEAQTLTNMLVRFLESTDAPFSLSRNVFTTYFHELEARSDAQQAIDALRDWKTVLGAVRLGPRTQRRMFADKWPKPTKWTRIRDNQTELLEAAELLVDGLLNSFCSRSETGKHLLCRFLARSENQKAAEVMRANGVCIDILPVEVSRDAQDIDHGLLGCTFSPTSDTPSSTERSPPTTLS